MNGFAKGAGVMKLTWVLMLVVLMAASPAWAGNGAEPYCSDYQGAKVIWVADSNLDEMAQNSLTFKATPVIRYNPGLLNSVDATIRDFVMNRQCGVHVLGFILTDAVDHFDARQRSIMADCWAASKLFYEENLSRAGLDSIKEKINAMSRESWLKFPGPVRVVDFESCALKDF
ncbi:hypothetical protein UZ36_05175 [Candidatus Nitromaritima sp. SCGC AAA799-C22]|nr:hypothetical protein UZ36_05175 [Candidatus Nitromaritima sp. SCGC AAA799-C22]